MALDRCLVLARAARAGDRDLLSRRVERLARWHGGRASWSGVGEHGLAGVVRYDDREESLAAPVVFGEEPAATDSASAVLAAGGERAELAGAAGGPGMLFAASSDAVEAWSTHAVAAAYLAHGRARVDPAAIPEQLAAEFVGGERSLIAGARALPLAVRVTVDDSGVRVEETLSLAERWAPVPEEDAAAHAERALMESLARRVPAGAHASLTAGLDSRVVAVALRELGIAARGFTWGEPDWEDVRGGAELAARLGMEHERVAIEWLADADARAEVGRQVRWNEGAIHVGFARLGWPAGMAAFVTGAGGEVGRAFYYRDERPAGEDATPERLAGVLARLLEPRLAGARPEAIEALRAGLSGWVENAAGAGLPGWRTLDVVYAEERVRRWLRGMLPRLDAPMIPALATPEIARALASMPLAERLSDGFHRGFLERHAPELRPPAAEPPRSGPGLAERIRPLTGRLPEPLRPRLRPLTGRLPEPLRPRLPGRLRPSSPSELGARWDERPGFREWIADGVLGSPLVAEPLGERWAGRTRERFLAGDGRAEAMALAAGGPVALAEELAELEPDG